MKEYPKALKQKVNSLLIILFFAFMLGAVFFILYRNIKIALMTLFLCIYLTYKIISIVSILKQKKYIEVSGICISSEQIKNILGKYIKVELSDTEYKEYTLIVNINEKITVGEMYKVYLYDNTDLSKELSNQDYIAIEKIHRTEKNFE